MNKHFLHAIIGALSSFCLNLYAIGADWTEADMLFFIAFLGGIGGLFGGGLLSRFDAKWLGYAGALVGGAVPLFSCLIYFYTSAY